MRGQDLLPPPASHVVTMCALMARRAGGDSGEIGIVGAVIIAAGLAAAAIALVAAITGKMQSWIAQIPGG